MGCDGDVAGSSALQLDSAAGRHRLFETLRRNQKTLHSILAVPRRFGKTPFGFPRPSSPSRRLAIALPSIRSGQVWEHALRDKRDYARHFDYIHYNPVKHGLVKCPRNWLYSTFHRWVKQGVYDPQWGCGVAGRLDFSDLWETLGE